MFVLSKNIFIYCIENGVRFCVTTGSASAALDV